MGNAADHGHSQKSHSHSPDGQARHGHAHPAHHHGPRRIVRRQLSRRLFVQEFGRRTMAVAILGTATVACAIDADEEEAVAAPTEPAASAAPDPTAAPAPTAATDGEPAPESDEASAGLVWEQVSLGFVSAYVLARGNEFAVVDTGLAGGGAQIGEALGLLGAKLDDLDHVILTHLHGDHVGGLPEVLDAAPTATAYAGEADIAGIQSPRPITAVNDGDDVFGLRVVGTPGHTAGHICLYDEAASLLIAGDAVVESNGVIEGAPEQFTVDVAAAEASARALASLQFENLAVGHGSPIRGGASEKLAAAFG